MFLLNKIISNLKIKGFPKVLTPHEKFIIAEALEEYFEKYEKQTIIQKVWVKLQEAYLFILLSYLVRLY